MKNNPYVGPRPYRREDRDKFYGRNREARDLLAKILAERVVLFYAQSGAGKSSLLNAKVIPALEEQDFQILPVARVGSEVPLGVDPTTIDNIFVFSVLLTLSGDDVDPQTLVNHTLTSFLKDLIPSEPQSDELNASLFLLIFDQFEELFTTHQDRWQEAQDFFKQVREALATLRYLGIVFSMREDYVASLDPYAALMPRRLRARFRMERIGAEGALEAITKPALNAGCRYDEGVAERIVDNLRRVKMQRLNEDGDLVDQMVPGPHVEPVQLQVICYQLWENLPEQDDYAIQWEEVEQYGDIDQALTNFYEAALTSAVEHSSVRERDVRRWFDEQMITPMETRGLVLRDKNDTAGLPNIAVDVLERSYLIRAESRAGARWYEISHDRLVEPIISSNRLWAEVRETPLRAAARFWEQTGDASLLYHGAALVEACVWAEQNSEAVEPFESAFLEASQTEELAQKQAQRRRRITMIGLAVGLTVMTILTVYAFILRQLADALAEEAIVNQLAGQAYAVWDDTGGGTIRSMLLATEAMQRQPVMEAHSALLRGVSLVAPVVSEMAHDDHVTTVDFGTEGRWAASGSVDGTIRLWEANAGKPGPSVVLESPVSVLAFSPDGNWLASGTEAGVLQVWDIANALHAGAAVISEMARVEHTASVESIDFSHQGHLIASAGADGTVRVLESGTWQVTAQFSNTVMEASPLSILRILFTSDDRRLITAGEGSKVRVWDVVTGELLAQVAHDYDEVWDLALSYDGHWLASGGSDGSVRVWEVGTWTEVLKKWFDKPVWAVSLSPDGRHVVAGGEGGELRVWDVQTGDEISKISHEGVVSVARFSPDGHWIASAGGDGLVKVWSAMTGREAARGLHEGSIWDVAFSPGGQWVISASDDGTAKVWSPWEKGMGWIEHGDEVWNIAFSPDGDWVVSGGDDNTARVWDAETGQVITTFAHDGSVREVSFSPDGNWVASSSKDGSVRVWEAATGKAIALLQHDARVRSMTFDAEGKRIVSGSEDKTARIWDVATGQAILTLPHEEGVKTVAFSADGRWVASGSADHTVRIWDAANGQEIRRMQHDDQVWAVAFSPDGKWLASGSNDHTVRAWNVQTGQEVAQMPFIGWMDSVTFSPDGKYLAFGGGDFARWSTGSGDLQVWKTESWALAFRWIQEGWVRDVAFSSDSQWLVSGGFDGTVRVWDVALGETVALIGHKPRVYAVAFSPDGHWVASSGMDKTARVWMWEPQDLLDAACTRIPRNFTSEEWEQRLYDQPYELTCPNLPSLEKEP